MSVEAMEWSKASRRSQNGSKGGMHLYIDAETLNRTLLESHIPFDAELEIRRYALKGEKGVARILVKIRAVKEQNHGIK